jgi:hypothetical protein
VKDSLPNHPFCIISSQAKRRRVSRDRSTRS